MQFARKVLATDFWSSEAVCQFAAVVFVSDKYHNKPEMIASRQLIDVAIKYR